MNRTIEHTLDAWLAREVRKPLVLRGARQVGKTWLVRDLANRHDRDLIELNFERDSTARRYFLSNDPREIVDEISLGLNRRITSDRAILFLDEIQAAGDLLAKLRWFSEEMPRLPVIAAGSLLEFTLSHHDFSMPVGRVGFCHIEPMGFFEFLAAHGQDILVERLRSWRPPREFSAVLHEQAMQWFHTYTMVGGMPAVVRAHAEGAGARACRERQYDLLATYRADFAKYAQRIDTDILDATLRSIAFSVGRKFVYSRVDDGVKQHQAKRSLEFLALARVCHIVQHSYANGLPLGGQTKGTFRKAILNDVGLLDAFLRLPAMDSFPAWNSIAPQVRGQIAEQRAGQLLRLLGPFNGDGPELYYWQREGGRPGEIDYLTQLEGRIVPVELKSGSAGAMKSLHQFMFDKKLDLAVRFDRNPPSQRYVDVKTTQGNPVRYRLLNLPAYYAEMTASFVSD